MPRRDLDRAVTPPQLRTFRAVFDRLSFSAAAVELHLGESSVSCQVKENQLVRVVPAGHPLSRHRRLRPQDFAGESFPMREPASGTRQCVEEPARREGVELQVGMEPASNGAINHAVEGGLGVAVLSRHAVAPERSAGGPVVVDVKGFPTRRPWGYVLLQRRHLPSVLREVVEFLRGLAWPRPD